MGTGEMKTDSSVTVILRKGEGRTLKSGGLWVYDNEISHIEGSYANGDIVAVRDFDGFFMGWGFINDRSKIRVRLMSRREDAPVTPGLIENRVRDAWEYRKSVMAGYIAEYLSPADKGAGYRPGGNEYSSLSCRLVFGEADLLPGITIDKFADVLVIESLALGTDLMKDTILEACRKVLGEDGVSVRGIYERSDARVRELEGLERTKGFIGEPFDARVPVEENGIKYYVDVENGQKTGFFLDQKFNRQAIRGLCRGGRVLDCFTHTGSFALNAAAAGAADVLAVDASETGIAQAVENARINGLSDRIRFEVADVFDLLPALEEKGETFDVVILDPPAFTKSRASVKKAVTGYREINMRGMRLVKNGGFLATCSCSHFMEPELFARTIHEAAKGAHRTLKQVEFRTQSPDHPIIWTGSDGTENSYYLKFYIFQVCGR